MKHCNGEKVNIHAAKININKFSYFISHVTESESFVYITVEVNEKKNNLYVNPVS